MCRVEDAEQCEFLSRRVVKARKEHECTECGRVILIGEKYESAVGQAGEFFTNKTCAHCIQARDWLYRECNGFVFGAVEEDLREHWQNGGIHTMELGRLIVGMARKWKGFRDRSMSVPTVR